MRRGLYVAAVPAGLYGLLRAAEWAFGWYVRQACRPQGRVLP